MFFRFFYEAWICSQDLCWIGEQADEFGIHDQTRTITGQLIFCDDVLLIL